MPKWKKPKNPHVHRRDPEKESHWRKQIMDHAGSGLAKTTFCKQRGLNPHNFQYWLEEIKRRDAEKDSSPSKKAAPNQLVGQSNLFVPVQLTQPNENAGGRWIDILLPGGSSIRVTEHTPMHLLSELFKMLEGKC